MRRVWLAVVLASSACSLLTSLDSLSGSPDAGKPDAATNDGGDGGVACQPPLTACGGGCVDLTKDGANCGKCGRSCFGATCTAGKCPAVPVATGLSNPFAIRSVTTPDVVVVASDDPLVSGSTATGGLFRIPKPSGTPTRLWTDVSNTVTVVPRSGLAVSGTEAFFIGRTTNTYGLYGARLNAVPGGLPTNYNMNVDMQFHGVDVLAEDAGTFFAIGKTYGTQVRRGTGGPPVDLTLTGGDELVLPPDAPFVVMSDEFASSVIRCDRAPVACTPVTLYNGPRAQLADDFQTVGTTVFWTSHTNADVYSIVACSLPGPCPTPVVIANGEGVIGALAVDSTGAYWTDTVAGRIRTCSDLVKGCATSATTVIDGEANAAGIAVDSTAIYWTIRAPAGAVRRIAK